MAAGLLTITVLDGLGNPFTGLFWSSDGAETGSVSPVHIITNGTLTADVTEDGLCVAMSTIPVIPTVTPVISTTPAYSDGDVLGGVMSFTVANAGSINGAEVVFKSGTFLGTVDLVLFNANPAGTYTDNAAFALSATDAANVIGVIHLTDWTSMGGALAQVQALAMDLPYSLAATTLYVVAVVHGTPTFVATTDAIFTISTRK